MALRSTMGEHPLTLHHFFDRMRDLHHDKRVVTRTDRGVHEATYGEVTDRVLRLISALRDLGVRQGDVVGTVMMNSQASLSRRTRAARAPAAGSTRSRPRCRRPAR